MKKIILLVSIPLLFFSCSSKEGKVEKILIDGVTHIMNPEQPLKGKILLEIEKIRGINPYLHEEVDLGGFYHVRDTDGEVILFTSNKTEAQRFSLNGEYLGSLARKGQGPGEFPDYQLFWVHFMNGQIWASGALKMAMYDKNGQFLQERKIGYRPSVFVDENTFFIEERTRDEEGLVSRVTLVNLSKNEEKESTETDFIKERNAGWIQRKDRGGGFTEPWGVPDIEYAYDPKSQKLYGGLNSEYKIYVKNLKPEIMYVIEKPYKHVRIGMDDKRKLLSWANKDDDFGKWALSAYPNTLVAFKNIKVLPNGYLAVYRVSGVQTYEVDVFDPEGRFVYIMTSPQEISLDEVKFYEFGFATTETQEDEFVFYTEYKIKNLPDIFKN